MIRGIGVDIIEIDRMEQSVTRFGDRLLKRIFTQNEIDYCRGKYHFYQHLAARFAAKEAFSKAIGTGLRESFGWKDIEVINDPLGKPHFTFHGSLREALGKSRLLLSLSHSEHNVVAMVLLEDEG